MPRIVISYLALAFALALAGGCGQAKNDAPAVLDLDSPAPAGSHWPHLQAAAGDTILMSWLEPHDNGDEALAFSRYRDGSWDVPRTIATGSDWFVNWADFPSVAAADGVLLAHWLVRSADTTYAYDIALARSVDDGKTWLQLPTPHDDGTPTEHGFVSMAGSAAGFGLVWLDGRNMAASAEHENNNSGGGMTLRYASISTEGERSGDEELDALTCDCCQTDMVQSDAGGVVFYRDRDGNEVRDINRVILSAGQWSAPAVVAEDGWVIAGCPVNGPAAAATGPVVVVAWFTAPDSHPQVRLARSTDGGVTFGTPVVVAEEAPVGRVDVELLDDGAAIVSWLRTRRDGGGALSARRVGTDGAMGRRIDVVALDASRAGGFPQMLRNGEKLLFAWTQTGEEPGVRTAALAIAAVPPPGTRH